MTTRGAKRPSSPAASDGSPVGKAGFVFPGLILGAKRRHCESAAGSADSEWTALYTTQLTQKEKRYHDGAVRLVQAGPHLKKILLLDEEGQVIGSRHLKPGESIESGKKSHVPNYLVEICEARNEKKEAESLGEDLNQTGLRNEDNTSDKMGAKTKSSKFVSPFKSQDVWKGNWENTTSSSRPQIGKTTFSSMDGALNFDVLPDLRRGKSDSEVNKRADKSTLGIMDDPLKFNDFQWGTSTNSIWPEVGKSNSSSVGDPLQFHDLKVGKSGCSTSFIRREVGKSTFGNKGDSLRTGSQIMSLMKPPSQVEYPQSAPYGQPCSLRSSESRMTLDVSRRNNTVVDGSNGTFYASGNSGVSHFATELRTATQSCLSLETPQRKNPVWPHHWTESSGNSHPTNDDQTIMRAPAFEGQETMNGLLAYYISNAKGQRQASSNHHTGSSNDTVPVRNVTSDPGLQQDKSGTTGQQQECKSRSQDRRDYRGS